MQDEMPWHSDWTNGGRLAKRSSHGHLRQNLLIGYFQAAAQCKATGKFSCEGSG
jgi:hypothetical protein